MLPGFLSILVGALIVIEPKVLVWLMAVAAVVLGIMLLVLVGFIRKLMNGRCTPESGHHARSLG